MQIWNVQKPDDIRTLFPYNRVVSVHGLQTAPANELNDRQALIVGWIDEDKEKPRVRVLIPKCFEKYAFTMILFYSSLLLFRYYLPKMIK